MKGKVFGRAAVLVALSAGVMGAAQQQAPKPPSEAQKAFVQLKALAGSWEGTATTDPPVPALGNGARVQVLMRVTARGNTLLHELHEAGKAEYEPTLFYVDGDRVLLTHYCDAGNQPRMGAKVSPDGKTMEFDLIDLTGIKQNGYMRGGAITVIDENHHTEDWYFSFPGDKAVHAHFDLQRQ